MDRVLDANLQSIKGSLQCSEIAERSGETDLHPEGEHLRGRCPLPQHYGKSPSFYCYSENGFYAKWRCHRCDEGGDVVDLHDALYGPFQTIYMTLSDMSARWGIKLWEDEDLMSGVELVRKKARAKAWEDIQRAYRARMFAKHIAPDILAIKDEKQRAAEMALCLQAARLA